MITSFPDYEQQATFRWVPWHIQYRKSWQRPMAWLRLGGGWFASYGLGLEPDERPVLRLGQWLLSRPETPLEREERLDGEAEAAWEEHEANRYTEWSY
jgi:hypothetical protein